MYLFGRALKRGGFKIWRAYKIKKSADNVTLLQISKRLNVGLAV